MLTPGARIGKYEIVEQIGRGGMATVYKALQTGLDRYVALKVLPPAFTTAAADDQFQERFQREAVMIANLRHPNILTIFDFGTDDGYTYLVSELVAGGTLTRRLGRPLSVAQVTTMLGPVADALDYAHQRGIVHRDVKPANVLLAEDGRPVLADFGIARMLDNTSGLTMAGRVVGTPSYMAPEQATGAPADSAADRYALGVVAYEMLTGRVPFVAETTHAVLYAHISRPPTPPHELNPAISPTTEAALLKMLAKRPEERFARSDEFIEALAAPTLTVSVAPPTVGLPDIGGRTLAAEIGAQTVAAEPPERPTVAHPQPAFGGNGRPIFASPPVVSPPGDDYVLHSLGPPTAVLDRRGRTRRRVLLGVGAGLLIATGVTSGRFVFGRRGRQDDPPVAETGPATVASSGQPSSGITQGTLPTVTPAAPRVVDSVTPSPRTPTLQPAAVTPTTAPPPRAAGPSEPTVGLPPLSSWTRMGSMSATWNVNATGVATASVTDGSSMLVSPTSFSDVDLSAELSTPNREASLAVRVRNDGNGYLGIFVPDGAAHLKGRGGSVSLFKAVDGEMTRLATARVPAMVQVRDTVRMRLIARGQSLAVFMNGREVARVADTTHSEGRVGLRVFADADGPCDATFANVRIGLS